ncbi:MAG: hypothetical protein Unbinned400contig1000_16 [Prokaryotic dsDNA virus sp.]|nr:MAG: hypothetical protein Unbinned400contig1000_16 [Prokaryotic dsDNA virus sp.]
MRIMVGIPTLDNVYWKFFLHTVPLIAKLKTNHLVSLCCVNRCAIDRARDITVEIAFKKDCDRILFIDDDTLIPDDTFEKLNPLLDDDKILSASGISYQRGHPFLPMVYKFKDFKFENIGPKWHSNQLIQWPDEPFRVSCNGMGVSLLDVHKMRDIPKPCFSRNGPGTEDFFFYEKVAAMGYEAWVDPSVKATHIGNRSEVTCENHSEFRRESVLKDAQLVEDEGSGRGMVMEAVL